MQGIDNSLAIKGTHLGEAFSGFWPDAAGLTITELAGDASSRQYFRISDAENRSWILQKDKAFLASAQHLHPYLSAQNLLKHLELPVPHIFASSPERGWILMQDLGDETLQNQSSPSNYEKAIDLLVDFVAKSEEFIRQKNDMAKYTGPHLSWAFDEEKLGQEMQHTAQHLIEGLFDQSAGDFKKHVQNTVQSLARRPRFLCHRDYHCRNLMSFEKQLWLIDFQDARMGPLSYDLVSILWDPYSAIQNDFRNALLLRWRQKLEAKSQELGLDNVLSVLRSPQIEVEIERMKIQRMLKAAGSYAGFLFLKKRKDYLPSIEPALQVTAEALRRLKNDLRDTESFSADDERLLTLVESLQEKASAIISAR